MNTSGGNTTADNASRKILLGETKSTGVPLVHESHAGGQIVFSPDGTLLVTTGDNASYASVDVGSASETYWQQAINDGLSSLWGLLRLRKSWIFNAKILKILRGVFLPQKLSKSQFYNK